MIGVDEEIRLLRNEVLAQVDRRKGATIGKDPREMSGAQLIACLSQSQRLGLAKCAAALDWLALRIDDSPTSKVIDCISWFKVNPKYCFIFHPAISKVCRVRLPPRRSEYIEPFP